MSFLSSIWFKIIIALVAGGLIWGAIHSYNEGIAQDERLKNQNAQMIQLNKEMVELQSKMDELDQVNEDILIELSKKNNTIIERHNEVRTYLGSPEAQASNREASEPIKETIRMLRNEK